MRESSSSSTLRPDGRVALVSDTIGMPPVPPGQLAQANCGAGYPRGRAANPVWPGGKLHPAVGDILKPAAREKARRVSPAGRTGQMRVS